MLKKVISIFKSLFSYGLIGSLFLFLWPPILLLSLLPRRYRFRSRCIFSLLSVFYNLILFSTFVRIKIKGDRQKFNQQILFVSNHQSTLDIIIMGKIIGSFPHVWFAKYELGKNFIMGLWMRRMSALVDYRCKYKSSKALLRGISLMKKYKLSGAMFPEGGRYTDGKLHPFFKGFAVIAKRIGCPVVPVMINNAYKVYPPGSIFLKDETIYVTIGPAFVCKSNESYDEFTKRVYGWFAQQGTSKK
ncbi:1-acyl-sn-glycerol-3-phosphate acyltransferase [bacterium]|jgi:1-acyl-sn-glycerol-3-phosphate acyltransferase|nr:1-acyl-sn-glycerol-3-phosphate acyltransferase [bacterium]